MKIKRSKNVEITLSKEEFDEILKDALKISGNIDYRFIEGGDYDRGTYHIKGIDIWSEDEEDEN